MLPSACSFIVDGLTFRQTDRTDNKERQESKHAHKNQETNENTIEKHKWKRAQCNHVQEKATKAAKQIPLGI
jgi:hypothetical protein